MRFEAKSVDPSLMRYVTTGDWEIIGDLVSITVADYGMRDENAFLVALHELVESFVCNKDGIKEKRVSDESTQHMIAADVERIVCNAMGIDWDEHKRVWNAIQFNHTNRGLLVCDKCAFGVRAVKDELK